MIPHKIIEDQLDFYKKGNAGCLFAAHAAVDPNRFGWYLSVCDVNQEKIEAIISESINDEKVSTQSIIFPRILSRIDLKQLLITLLKIQSISLGQEEECEGSVCIGLRLKIGMETSWMLGFGSFDFLPKTRQALFTEIVFRCKPKPEYRQTMKESDPNVLHVAHMHMQDMREAKFKSLWYGSMDKVEEILGRPSDLRSKAKTTFALPIDLYQDFKSAIL